MQSAIDIDTYISGEKMKALPSLRTGLFNQRFIYAALLSALVLAALRVALPLA